MALLRVLVKKPLLFLFDEATANIDPFTERQIQHVLKVLMSQHTSIVIAHRLSTIQAADRIVVLANGEIVEQGNFVTLLQTGTTFRNLYETFFYHQDLSAGRQQLATTVVEEGGGTDGI